MFVHPNSSAPTIQQHSPGLASHGAAAELRSHQLRYLSDDSDSESEPPADNSESEDSDSEITAPATSSTRLPAVPALKRRRVDVLHCEQRRMKQEKYLEELKGALAAIEKHLKSKKTAFIGGLNGLQAKRARSIQSYLMMVVKKGRLSIDASKRAAESHGFAAEWGGRQVRRWTRLWVSEHKLPESLQGRHAKVYSLLSDPAIAAELRAYIRSNKWAMNPDKLVQFSQNKLIPAEADKYLKHVVDEEMPCGLKRYMELEIFPCIHLKVSHGISLNTARRFANDAVDQYWVFEDEFRLRKKGAGRGLHRSDVICSTIGHLVEAGESLEYGKNYDGYWRGEHFCNQLKDKIIPAFEQAHGPGYQALFLIDNSQGHAVYSENALLVSRMNVNPGGKQAHMRNGWFIHDGIRIEQEMMFPTNHPEHPGEPKGIKTILTEHHCDCTFETLKDSMPRALASVELQSIRLWEHRTHRWIEAYQLGLGIKDAQLKVRQFSSMKYKSHRRVPETVAQLFD
ncbi:uncharacterized protein EDB91DRAFT_1061178 [Suillus paluster]|uniref:uncharacterized protein n=1 Tax=Suillus paluster TaxID=48578 RepID=UPI001B87FC29|nr:uncharacterized protein EDB91DRAFT_1061178 [Suillus paluster]KAG1727295.1 hypothetical protein EDB91DRAFT_1061178 [Suillus paluster]